MKNKRKMSVTIDADVFEAIEKLAKSKQVAKSHLAEEAFKEWIRKYIEREMAKGYKDMSLEDKEFSALAFESQKEIL